MADPKLIVNKYPCIPFQGLPEYRVPLPKIPEVITEVSPDVPTKIDELIYSWNGYGYVLTNIDSDRTDIEIFNKSQKITAFYWNSLGL